MPRLVLLVLFLALEANTVHAGVVVVPDDSPTVQAAIDTQADTVMVRDGAFNETPVIRTRIALLAHPDNQEGFVQLDGLVLAPIRGGNDDMYVRRFRFLGPLWINNPLTSNTVCVEDCQLDAGLLNAGEFQDTGDIIVRRCVSYGGLQLYARFDVVVDSSIVVGGVDARGHDLTVSASQIAHPGGFGIIAQDFDGRIRITDSIISDCDFGIICSSGGPTYIANNAISDCPGGGIEANSDATTVEGNSVERCRVAIALFGYPAVAERNVVNECLAGVLAESDHMRIVGNTVSNCEALGIRASGFDAEHVVLSGNTVAFNGTAGIEVRGWLRAADSILDVSRNIAYRNGTHGLVWNISADGSSPMCNDWFGNEVNDVDGRERGTTDLSVDPLFCGEDTQDFTLREDSPLLDASGCGLIGALGLGCGATPVLLALLRAEPAEDGIRIEWQWGGLELPADSWIERSEDASGPWDLIATERHSDGGITVSWDRHVDAGRTYFYRLAWVTESGERATSEMISATVLGAHTFALRPAMPNPSKGRAEIAWSLPRAGQVDLTVFDIAGREVTRLVSGRAGAGKHTSTWNGQVAPGLYFVRLRYDGRELTRRILLRR